jgi:hypothetical protein
MWRFSAESRDSALNVEIQPGFNSAGIQFIVIFVKRAIVEVWCKGRYPGIQARKLA